MRSCTCVANRDDRCETFRNLRTNSQFLVVNSKLLHLRSFLASLICIFVLCWPMASAEPIRYRFTFPEPQHRWMQAEAMFTDLPNGPLELRMSRAAPGRYAPHDFAKNVYDVHAFDSDGAELPSTRPDADGWTIPKHGDKVVVRYRIYGDRVDGTYLAIDTTHAHINMPAAVMWARGLDDRPSTLTFTPPSGMSWQI